MEKSESIFAMYLINNQYIMYLIWLKVNWLAPLLEMSALTDEAQLTTNENNWGQ